jgi:TolA-binding protein
MQAKSHFLSLALAATLFALANSAGAAQLQPLPVTPLVIQAQADPTFRINELEERVRQLTGRVEDLNFLLLQMQENMRKMQEDNELRFQELEDQRGSLSRDPNRDVALGGGLADGGSGSLEKPDAASGQDAADDTQTADGGSDVAPAAPPRALGTLTFDADGNVIDAAPADQAEDALASMERPFGEGSPGAVDASQFGATPGQVLSVARSAIVNRRFGRAETAYRAAMKAWPSDPSAGEMGAGLGEALFWQKKYFAAAEMHLETHRKHPDAQTAPDNLLGLALSLAGLNQREVACATYAEVLKQYPKAERRLGERIKDEQAAARC